MGSTGSTLGDRLPPRPGTPADELLDLFLGHVRALGLELYPAQEQALLELVTGSNVILATPTGSGKSLVALALHFFAMSEGRRSYYTAPIKALVSEKFFALCRAFGAESVGLVTGDASVNRDAPILCCTAEILSNLALREGKDAPVDAVVTDEFHYYSDRDRGVAWQVPLLVLERVQWLLMSATLGPTEFFEGDLARRTGRPTVTVRSDHRPVPLEYDYREATLHETVASLAKTGRTPAYVVNFTQRAASETAQDLMSQDLVPREQKRAIAEELGRVRFDSPYGKEMQRFLAHGVGLHHAGLLPQVPAPRRAPDPAGAPRGRERDRHARGRRERAAPHGRLHAALQVRRREDGAPHRPRVPADRRARGAKGLRRPGARRRARPRARRRDPEARGQGRERPRQDAAHRPQEAARPRVRALGPLDLRAPAHVDARAARVAVQGLARHGPRGALEARRPGLPRARAHRPPEPTSGAQRRIHGREAKTMFESLVGAGIVELEPDGRSVRVHADLQEDFSVHHALSLWLLDTVPALDREGPTYALDLLTLVESILEDPEYLLRQQLELLKRAKLGELKMAGASYEERVAELEKMEYPKPLRELVYESFNEFRRHHPWVRGDDVRPKSIARDMVERFMSFGEYVREYELGRAEGTLLRYLSDAYKALVQSVPAAAKTPEVEEIEVFLRTIVRAVDSSLLDEWERMRDGAGAPLALPAAADEPVGEVDVTRDERGFTVLVRNLLFQVLRAVGRRDWAAASSLAGGLGAEKLEEAFAPFFAEHAAVKVDGPARATTKVTVTPGPDTWEVVQVVSDPEGDDDWALFASVDVAASRAEGAPVVTIRAVGR